MAVNSLHNRARLHVVAIIGSRSLLCNTMAVFGRLAVRHYNGPTDIDDAPSNDVRTATAAAVIRVEYRPKSYHIRQVM